MNYKQSNWLIDTVMPDVPANAFKVIALIARKTWGWGKERESISLEDFRAATGVSSKQTASRAVEDALESGYIQRTPVKNTFEYWPVMNGTESVPNGTEIGAVDNEGRYRNRGGGGTEIGAANGTNPVPKQSRVKEVKEISKETPPKRPPEPELTPTLPGAPPEVYEDERPAGITLPRVLDIPKFWKVWRSFESHRDQSGAPLSYQAKTAMIDKMARIGPDKAIWLIDISLTNGYKGILWDKLDQYGSRDSPNGSGEKDSKFLPKGHEVKPAYGTDW